MDQEPMRTVDIPIGKVFVSRKCGYPAYYMRIKHPDYEAVGLRTGGLYNFAGAHYELVNFSIKALETAEWVKDTDISLGTAFMLSHVPRIKVTGGSVCLDTGHFFEDSHLSGKVNSHKAVICS